MRALRQILSLRQTGDLDDVCSHARLHEFGVQAVSDGHGRLLACAFVCVACAGVSPLRCANASLGMNLREQLRGRAQAYIRTQTLFRLLMVNAAHFRVVPLGVPAVCSHRLLL